MGNKLNLFQNISLTDIYKQDCHQYLIKEIIIAIEM